MSIYIKYPEENVFIIDPGHGWLRVPRTELTELGILDKISSYSYQTDDGKFVFLEEDCDLTLYVEAKGCTHVSQWRSREIYDDDQMVRQLPRFYVG